MYVYFHQVHVYFLDFTCKSIIGDNDCTELRAFLMLMFVRTVDFLHVSINQYPQHFGRFYRWAVLLEPLLLTCHAFVYCLRKENISDTYYSKKTVLILNFIPLIH